MIAQILSDAWKVVPHRDAQSLQALSVADTRELEKLRGGNGSRRHDHLARATRLAFNALHLVAHAYAARSFQDEGACQRVGLHGQVGPRSGRIEIASRRAHAPTAADRGLGHVDPFLVPPVVVAVGLEADALGGLKEAIVEPPALVDIGHLERPVAAAPRRIPAGVALHAPESGQHILPAPAAVAELRPVVVVLALSAHPHHAVDGAGAAQHAPARDRNAPAAGGGIWL